MGTDNLCNPRAKPATSARYLFSPSLTIFLTPRFQASKVVSAMKASAKSKHDIFTVFTTNLFAEAGGESGGAVAALARRLIPLNLSRRGIHANNGWQKKTLRPRGPEEVAAGE